ncbi:hypothetical protein IFM89_000319, partial [Coptis chinensis]
MESKSVIPLLLVFKSYVSSFRILSAYSKVPPKLEVCSTKRDLNLFGTGDGEIDFEESETVGKNVMETATSITNASNAANPGQYQPPAVIPPSFRSLNVPTTVPALELPYAPSPRSGPSVPFPNFSETSIISNRVTNLVKPSVFLMQPPLSTYMIPSTSSSTPTTPINGLGITRDKVRDTLMRLVQGFTTYDPVLSFKMGKQEVLRKWSSSLNAYLVVCILLKVAFLIETAFLQELVFRDNKLMKMPDVSIFKSLLVFDVSYNEILSLNGVSKVSSTLKELYVSKNEVTKMEELDHLYNLHILELGSNRSRVMENLHNLTNLQELWLGRNRIRTVNLCGLKCIRKISLQSNCLTNMTGFQVCYLDSLFFIDKQEQRIMFVIVCVTNLVCMLPFQNCVALGAIMVFPVNLRILDISSNKLTTVDDIEKLTRLEDLWMNDNQIASLDGFDLALAGSRDKLTSIYVEHNPCVRFFIRHILFFQKIYLPGLHLECE